MARQRRFLNGVRDGLGSRYQSKPRAPQRTTDDVNVRSQNATPLRPPRLRARSLVALCAAALLAAVCGAALLAVSRRRSLGAPRGLVVRRGRCSGRAGAVVGLHGEGRGREHGHVAADLAARDRAQAEEGHGLDERP